MNARMNMPNTSLATLALCCSLFAAAPAHALGTPLDDEALSQVWGQALLDLTNTTSGGYEFSRLTMNADITLSMNLSGIKLGTYGGGTDIDISTLNFGRSDATDAQRTVAITDPYFEWVYSGTGANAQVVGMRLGFGGISGDVGLTMNTVSGSLAIDTGNGTTATVNGSRQTTTSTGLALSSIGGVTAGNSDGASRDFFISVLKQAVTWPTTDSALGTSTTSQAGFWLNWTDRLKAINTTGIVPPNVAKIGP